MQDWEKTLARKLQDNWRKEFTVNPMGGGVSYRDLTVFERVNRALVLVLKRGSYIDSCSLANVQVNILTALCHWKLDTCTEIHNHIAILQKENNDEAFAGLVRRWNV